jgi:hypothetical protein
MHPVEEAEAGAEAKEGGAEDKVDGHNDMILFFFSRRGLVPPNLQARGTHISPRVFFGFLISLTHLSTLPPNLGVKFLGLRFAIVFSGIEKGVQNPVDKWVNLGSLFHKNLLPTSNGTEATYHL